MRPIDFLRILVSLRTTNHPGEYGQGYQDALKLAHKITSDRIIAERQIRMGMPYIPAKQKKAYRQG